MTKYYNCLSILQSRVITNHLLMYASQHNHTMIIRECIRRCKAIELRRHVKSLNSSEGSIENRYRINVRSISESHQFRKQKCLEQKYLSVLSHKCLQDDLCIFQVSDTALVVTLRNQNLHQVLYTDSIIYKNNEYVRSIVRDGLLVDTHAYPRRRRGDFEFFSMACTVNFARPRQVSEITVLCVCQGGFSFSFVKVTGGRWPSHLQCAVERDREST